MARDDKNQVRNEISPSQIANTALPLIPTDFINDPDTGKILDSAQLYSPQRTAAIRVLDKIAKNYSVVQILAPTQGGKSGTSVAICRTGAHHATKQGMEVTRNPRTRRYTVLYVIALPSNDLEAQAEALFSDAQDSLTAQCNAAVTVLKLRNIGRILETLDCAPALLVIDESHLGNSSLRKLYPTLVQHLRDKWPETRIVLISATPHSLLVAREEDGYISGLNRYSSVVIQQPGDDYRGLTEYVQDGQIINLGRNKQFTKPSALRDLFFNHIKTASRRLSFIRIGAGKGQEAIDIVTREMPDAEIVCVGKEWKHVDPNQMSSLDEFKHFYANLNAIPGMENRKVVVLVRGGLSAGIDLGNEIKNDLSAIWESFSTSLASALQGLTARTMGYTNNPELRAFCFWPNVERYVEAYTKMYTQGNLGPMYDYLHEHALKDWKLLDSEEPRGKDGLSRTKVREHFHKVGELCSIDINAFEYDQVPEIGAFLAREMNDPRLEAVVHGALSGGKSSTKNDENRWATRNIDANYLFDTRHNMMEKFRLFSQSKLEEPLNSFEKLLSIGGKTDNLSQYVVFRIGPQSRRQNPASDKSINEFKGYLKKLGPQFSLGDENQTQETIAVFKKGEPFSIFTSTYKTGCCTWSSRK